MKMTIAMIKNFVSRYKRKIPRIVIEPQLAFTDEEFKAHKNKLSQETIDNINENFQKIVDEVVSLSVEKNKIYVECIGTLNEHFVTILTVRSKK